MNFQTMNRQRKFSLIAAATGIISVFLPWVTISAFGMTKNINGFHGWGILVFLAFFAAAVITLTGNQTQGLEKNYWFLLMACGAIALLSIIIEIASSDSLGEGMGFVDAGIGFGLWIAIAAAAGIVLFAWVFKSPADNLKSGFEGLKKSISIPATSISKPDIHAEAPGSDKIIDLEKLNRLKANGSITEEEFELLKSKRL
jgi:hypothetical protein